MLEVLKIWLVHHIIAKLDFRASGIVLFLSPIRYRQDTGIGYTGILIFVWFLVLMTDVCKQIEWQIVISTFTESKVYFMIAVEIKILDMPSSGLNGPVIIMPSYLSGESAIIVGRRSRTDH